MAISSRTRQASPSRSMSFSSLYSDSSSASGSRSHSRSQTRSYSSPSFPHGDNSKSCSPPPPKKRTAPVESQHFSSGISLNNLGFFLIKPLEWISTLEDMQSRRLNQKARRAQLNKEIRAFGYYAAEEINPPVIGSGNLCNDFQHPRKFQ